MIFSVQQKAALLERFLRYVQISTPSKYDIPEFPSTKCQFDLGKLLVKELLDLGIQDAKINEFCIVTGTIPSNLDAEHSTYVPTVCFIAHLDTAPDESGENVHPRVIMYSGGNITYPNNSSLILTPEESPALNGYKGMQLVTSDGTTLLGADDKAGIAEIMTAVAILMTNRSIPHGVVKILITPDEEVGNGVEKVDVPSLKSDLAYTMDGDELGVLECETFNAMGGAIVIHGYNMHPGYAYNKMINSIRVLTDVLALFPAHQSPENTQNREGYLHPLQVTGEVNQTTLNFILRDFTREGIQQKADTLRKGVELLQQKYPRVKIEFKLKESYRNMFEILQKTPYVIEIAERAIELAKIPCIKHPIRGGTDGSRLSFMGLPTPNIFAGGINFHSKKEFIAVPVMEKAVEVILNIVTLLVKK